MVRFSPVTEARFAQVCALYQDVIGDMRARGLSQWEWGVYPTREQLERDVETGRLYQAEADGALVACFALSDELEAEYAQIQWQYGVRPATLHRLAMRGATPALMDEVLAFVRLEARRLGYDSLRLDTCEEDPPMLAWFRAGTTREAGGITLNDSGVRYACFESPLSAACPMLPIPMRPAYRHGDSTPWGGAGLRELYGRRIPDERTGEALEVSAIPGLESVTDAGETLSELIGRDGARLLGEGAGKPFPLLLKLLCAQTNLSVQVHPDDDYARLHESKLGKTEAWVILHAQPGACLLYGLREGVTREALEAALAGGGDVEKLIERVPVMAGDVFYMPSGMVHAIGGGIVLYEIQQSSDVTYRLWDYGRVNDKGEKRPLHIRQSLDVVRPELRGLRARLPQAGENRTVNLLDVPAFRLDCVCVNGEYALAEHPRGFRILTALAGLLLSWQGDAMELAAGDSVLLPAACPAVTLMGVGRALVAAEGA